MSSKVIKQVTILSGKGGTGKTTITAALAQISSPLSLTVDCDVDAPNLHLLLSPTNKVENSFSSGKLAIMDSSKCISCGKCLEVCRFGAISLEYKINDLKCEGCGACAWICPTKAISLNLQSIGVIFDAETRFGPLVHARLNIGAENSGKLVNEVIKRGHIKAEQFKKKIVFVDGSPGIGCPVIAALTNANLVIIVVEPTITAIHDMERIFELTQFFKLPAAIIINKNDINKDQTAAIRKFCNEGKIPLFGELPYHPSVYSAMVNGQTILEFGIIGMENQISDIWSQIQDLLAI